VPGQRMSIMVTFLSLSRFPVGSIYFSRLGGFPSVGSTSQRFPFCLLSWYNQPMSTIRSFIAIELSTEARTALANVQDRLKSVVPPKRVRWAAPENIHLTLHFLGNVSAAEVSKVTTLLQKELGAYRPFALRLEGLGCFPNTRRPRIVWVGVSGETEPLVALQRELGRQLSVIDYVPDSRPYSPHLTIGRVTKGLRSRELSRLGELLEQEQAGVGQLADLSVTEISLMRSDLKPTGPVYARVAWGGLKGVTQS
jgi:2'-5' RNA ligase